LSANWAFLPSRKELRLTDTVEKGLESACEP
jgi:hypothetical protein